MGFIQEQSPVKLFIAVTYQNLKDYEKVYEILRNQFGQIDLTVNYEFSPFTDYYSYEMGSNLYKTILSFENLIEKDNTFKLKHNSIKIEKKIGNKIDEVFKRDVNIDPGYLTEAKVILFTTKNFSHRIYIGNNIFAEITLTYRKNTYTSNNWTYPDYKSNKVIDFFNKIRSIYRNQLQHSH